MAEKISTSFRLTTVAITTLAAIAEREGIDRTDVLELLIRRRAEDMGIPRPETTTEGDEDKTPC